MASKDLKAVLRAAEEQGWMTFALQASDPDHAVKLAQVIFIEGASCSGLPPVEWGSFEIVPVTDEDEPVTEERQVVQPA